MKIAPLGFLAAVGIFLVTMAVSERGSSPDDTIRLPLDLDGIDTIVVHANQSTSIIIDNNKKFELAYDGSNDRNSNVDSKVGVIKEKNRLLINADLQSYGGVNISLPSSIRYLQLTDANVTVTDTIGALDVQMTEGSLRWSGNAKLLNISNVGDDKCDSYNCDKQIMISYGVIEQLHIEALKGGVALNKSNDLKAIRLSLGPNVNLSVSDANSIKKMQLEEYVEKNDAGVVTGK